MTRLLCVSIVLAAAACCRAGELSVEDFSFGPPLGSEGAKIEKVGTNDFLITLGHAPEHPGWPNHLQFRILRNAKGNAPHITAKFVGLTGYGFAGNDSSWSYDGNDWQPMFWKNSKTRRDGNIVTEYAEITFPTLERDTVWFGFEVPFTYEKMLELVEVWRKDPSVKVHLIGQSLDKRDLIRLEITDPNSPVPLKERWVHYFANQHPGETNSMWRMVGMIDWLLSDAGADARKRFICHFILMMSPDGIAAGWHRTNRQGIDMNRSYAIGGADPRQGHEPYLWQKDLEGIMASDCSATTIWSMHVWPGAADPSMNPGPETDNLIGPASQFAEILTRLDPNRALVKPLKYRDRMRPRSNPWAPTSAPADPNKPFRSGGAWGSGPGAQFGVTNLLCEGGAGLYTKKENLDSGVILIRGLAEYYHGTKANPAGARAQATTAPR